MLVMGLNENIIKKTYYLNYCEKYCNNITYTIILTPNFITCQLVWLLVINDEWWVHMSKNCLPFIVIIKKKKKEEEEEEEEGRSK